MDSESLDLVNQLTHFKLSTTFKSIVSKDEEISCVPVLEVELEVALLVGHRNCIGCFENCR